MKTCGIEAVDADGKVVHYFRRQAQAYRAGFVRSSITKCLAGKNKTHRGLRWRYAGVMSQLPTFVAERCTTEANAWPATPQAIMAAYTESLPEEWRAAIDTYQHTDLWRESYFWKSKTTDQG